MTDACPETHLGHPAGLRLGRRTWGSCPVKTTFMLMAQYDGKVVIPLDELCRDYFAHLTPTKFVEKVRAGEIKLPLVRLERSQKSAKGVPLTDFAAYLEQQISAAREDMAAMS